MNHTKLSKYLKVLIVCSALCGVALYLGLWFGVISEVGFRFLPWLVIVGCAFIPIYVALSVCWSIARDIGANRSFTLENARRFHCIARLAIWDAVGYFLAVLIYWLVGLGHPSLVLASLALTLVGAAIAVVCEGLSYLANKAALLQDQSDLTI